MPLTKKTYDWAETGTKTVPSAGKQQSGWVAGEQPTVGEENWEQGGQDIAIRELQTGDNPETTSQDVDNDDFAQWYMPPSKAWGYAWSAQNIYTASTTSDTLVDLAVSYISGRKRVFALETATGEVQAFDPVTATIDFTISNATLVAGLPATAGSWLPLSMCSDEAYLYLLFEETGVGAGTERHYVQSYDNDGTGVNSGWPAAGRQITTGNLAATNWPAVTNRTSKIIISGVGYITTLNGWVGAAYAAGYLSSVPFTSTLTTTAGSLIDEGGGDVSSIGSNFGTLYPTGAIASDHTVVGAGYGIYYAVADQTNFRGNMISSQAGSDQVGTGYTVFPLDFGSNNRMCQSMVYDGESLIAPVRVVGGSVSGGWFYHFDPITAATANQLTIDPDYPSPKEVAVDGLNAYFSTRVGDNPGGAHTNTKHNTILKVDTSALFPSGIYSTLTSAVGSRFNLEKVARNNTAARDANVDYLGPMLFDGRDLWVIQDIRPGGAYTFGSKIYRIPRVAIR